MRPYSFVVCFAFLAVATPVAAQTAPERDVQGVALLQKSFAALSGGVPIQDVALTGTMRRIAGSLEESGTATLKGTAAGASLTEFDLPSGTIKESRDIGAQPPTGSWEKSGGAAHAIASHNLSTDPTWFYPALLVERVLSSTAYSVVYVGPTTKYGAAVNYVRIRSGPSGTTATSGNQIAQTLGQMDLYLDAATNLPVALDFNTHPDRNALVNLSVEIRYLNYVRQGGALAPSEIQRYLDNTLLVDIQVTSAQFNTGLTSGALALQ